MMTQPKPLTMQRGLFRSFVLVGLLQTNVAWSQDSGVSILFGSGAVPAQQVSAKVQETATTPGTVQEAPQQVGELRQGEERGPIVLPPLPTRNLSISDIGTGKLPDDLVEGRLPPMQPLPYGPDRKYGLIGLQKHWTAPVICHQPLYFEDTMLERHGHERFPKLTPMLSGVRFFTGVATLPYQAYLHRPLSDQPNTGHFRPGSAAPGIRERAPYDKGALRFQILTTGASLVALQP
ncbi:hypothetical protein SH467x_004193 [Pirellulaceae bacterium SH467]|jgi:hypothetical protein